MSNVKIAAFDVDGVVVDLSLDWWKFLEHRSSYRVPYDTVSTAYDFGSFYPDVSTETSHSFWKSRDLYDGRNPIPGCKEAIRRFHENEFHVIFVSHVEGDHAKSKFEFLKRHFPFMKGYIPTREKAYVQPTIAFDDRVKHLANYKNIKEDCLTIQMLTPCDQSDFHGNPLEVVDYHLSHDNWRDDDLIDFLIERATFRVLS